MNIDNLTGRTLGPYELGTRLGKGGMGVVYHGVQLALEREVAIKVLSPDLAAHEHYMQHFYREARTAAGLEHAHIVPIYDYGVQDGISYVVMRLLVGGALGDRMRRREANAGPLPSLSEAAILLDQLGDALDYAHSQGVIHRDIKPANIMFDDRGAAYVVDFGLAKLLVETTGYESLDSTVGTPYYMPPEQWAGLEPTQAADQYALAVTLYQLVTGKLPFTPGAPHEMLQKHLHEYPAWPHEHRPDLPVGAAGAIMRALEKTPHTRWESCGAFAAAFRDEIRDVPAHNTGFMELPLISVVPSGASQATPGADPDAVQIAISPDSPLLTPLAPPLEESPTELLSTQAHIDQDAMPTDVTLPEPLEYRSARRFAIWGMVAVVIVIFVVAAVLLVRGNGGAGMSASDHTATADARHALTQVALMTLTGEPTFTPTPVPPSPTVTARSTFAVVLVDAAPVYSEPRAEAAVTGTLAAGVEALVIAKSADEQWYHVAAGSVSGWMAADVVRLTGNLAVPVYVPPTATFTSTPTPSPTHTPMLTDQPTATAGADPALFAPDAFERTALERLGLTLDYPSSWAPPVSQNDVIALLMPVDRNDPLVRDYPSITVARATPAQLVSMGLTTGGATPQAALESLLGADFSGQSVRDDRFVFPAYRLALRTADGYTWAWLIEVAADDWLMIIAVAPSTVEANAFHDGVLLPILSSLDVSLER